MRSVATIAARAVAGVASGEFIDTVPAIGAQEHQSQSDAVGLIINQLFRDLRSIHSAWRQAWPNQAAYDASKLTWLRAFIENGVCTQEQIDIGLTRCRAENTDFIPSPGKFVHMCVPLPEMIGLPSVETAYEQALRNCHPAMRGQEKWFHPAVYHATAAAGFHSLPLLSRELGLASFEKRYMVQVCKVWRGEDVGPLPAAEIAGPAPVITMEVGNKALAELRARRGGSRA